jgi:hypothetical protein
VERENSPREHKEFSQIIANLSTVLCSTGTILRRKGNGRGSGVGGWKSRVRSSNREENVPSVPGVYPINFTDPDGQTCTKDKDGNFHGDTCGKSTETGNKPDQVNVKGKPGSWLGALAWNFFFGMSNRANNFFRPVTNAMGIQPSYMQNVSTAPGAAGNAGDALAMGATFFIGPLGEEINITTKGLAHVTAGHTIGGAESAGNSIFNLGENLPGLIKGAEKVEPVRQAGGNIERIVDAGRNIGIDRTTGVQTTIYTVITRPNGDLVTAFPGRP